MDKRNWSEYNKKLIERGTYYINPKFLESWNAEKIGNPYFYPKSMIEFLAILHCRGNDYRTCEGIVEGISKNYKFEFPIISYTQICRRVNSLEVNFEINEENLIVAGDCSGEKSTKRGGWIKVVILGTPDGKIVDIRVGTESLDERASVRGMIKNNHKKINKIILDGLHDCKKTFNLCEKYKIETAIKIRKNAQSKARGSPRRKREVLFYQSMKHKQWVKEKDYGLRWPASEGIFSRQKTIFGEYVVAKKKRNMYHEVKLKFWAVNKLNEI